MSDDASCFLREDDEGGRQVPKGKASEVRSDHKLVGPVLKLMTPSLTTTALITSGGALWSVKARSMHMWGDVAGGALVATCPLPFAPAHADANDASIDTATEVQSTWAHHVSQPPIERGEGRRSRTSPSTPCRGRRWSTRSDSGGSLECASRDDDCLMGPRVRRLLLDSLEDDLGRPSPEASLPLDIYRNVIARSTSTVSARQEAGARLPLMMSNY
jgi:hypothetical protein